MTKRTPDWKSGAGYPDTESTLDDWELEFLKRNETGLKGFEHFKLQNGNVEFFHGPAIIPINDDGSIVTPPDDQVNSANTMVIQFFLDRDIDEQIKKAKRWLEINQNHYFVVRKNRVRLDKFKKYLRALDADRSGCNIKDVVAVLYPDKTNDYPDLQAEKEFYRDVSRAKKLVSQLVRQKLTRK